MKADEVNAALAADPLYLPDPDPDQPREIHETHHVVDGVCLRCGVPEFWPAVEKRCGVKDRPRREVPVSIVEASLHLLAEWRRFASWWHDQGHAIHKPSLAEWFAEWFEWRRHLDGESRADLADLRRAAIREALAACEAGRDAGRDAIAILREMVRP